MISDHGYDEMVEETIKKRHIKLIHEGNYVAEVVIDLVETGEGWSPYLSLEEAQKLADVREALRQQDFKKASSLAKVYRLTPIAI